MRQQRGKARKGRKDREGKSGMAKGKEAHGEGLGVRVS